MGKWVATKLRLSPSILREIEQPDLSEAVTMQTEISVAYNNWNSCGPIRLARKWTINIVIEIRDERDKSIAQVM